MYPGGRVMTPVMLKSVTSSLIVSNKRIMPGQSDVTVTRNDVPVKLSIYSGPLVAPEAKRAPFVQLK